MICAVLNCLSCGSKNRRNRHVFNFVHVCLLPTLIRFVRLCGSELVSVRLLIAFCADPANLSCGQFSQITVSLLLFPMTFDVYNVISGNEISEVKDGEVLKYPNVLSCGPLVPQGGWTLGGEDPKYYKKNKLWRTARREWPDVPYPVPEQLTPAPADEEEDTPTHTQEELKELMSIHHSFTRLLEKMGVDPCADYQEQKVENILVGIKSSDLQCKVCGKIYTASMRMKRHFKKRHIGKTNYQCGICKKYYTDASSLKEHEGNHDESLRPYKCTKCSKRFATEYKLTEHLLMHQGKTFICSFSQCGRLFTNLQEGKTGS